MMRGGTLLILGDGVKGQGHLCPPARGCHALRCLVYICIAIVKINHTSNTLTVCKAAIASLNVLFEKYL